MRLAVTGVTNELKAVSRIYLIQRVTVVSAIATRDILGCERVKQFAALLAENPLHFHVIAL